MVHGSQEQFKLRWNQNCWKTNKNTKMFCLFGQFHALRQTVRFNFKRTGNTDTSNKIWNSINDIIVNIWRKKFLSLSFWSVFFCDCFEGIRKQSIGLLYKTGTIEVDHDVRPKPLSPRGKGGDQRNCHNEAVSSRQVLFEN